MNCSFVTHSPEETFALGSALGKVLHDGDFIGLKGELGAGKTLFSRGVAQGLGVPLEDVSSPTYSIIQSYQGRLKLHHADLYRLASEADLFSTGYVDVLEEGGAFLVEWVDRVQGASPDDALEIVLEVTASESREMQVTASGPQSESLLERWTVYLKPH